MRDDRKVLLNNEIMECIVNAILRRGFRFRSTNIEDLTKKVYTLLSHDQIEITEVINYILDEFDINDQDLIILVSNRVFTIKKQINTLPIIPKVVLILVNGVICLSGPMRYIFPYRSVTK